MFLMLHNTLINKQDIDNLFCALANEYESLGGKNDINIYLVGGASIILNFDYRMSTIDIDALFKTDELFQESIKSVSKKLHLQNDWINQDFVNTPSYSPKILKYAKPFSTYGNFIHLFTLEPKYLIAMKLKSSRPTGGDLDDIVMMIYEMRYKNISISYDEIIKAYNDLYSDFSNTYDYFLERAKNAFEVPIEDFAFLFERK